MISALKLVTNLFKKKGNNLGEEAKGFAESSKNRLAQAFGVVRFGRQCKTFGFHGRAGTIQGGTPLCAAKFLQGESRKRQK